MERVAIIDLGTNTFHLLIVEQGGQSLQALERRRIYVKLALEGIEVLSEAAMDRGIEALKILMEVVESYQVTALKAIGTAALRTASNAGSFIRRIQDEVGITVEIIDGQEEARLIYLGVSQIWKEPESPVLLMDIGGGSVEFIIADKDRYLWSASYPLGVAILYRKFHQEDPIPPAAVAELNQFIEAMVTDLATLLAQYPINKLIGASGTFDVVGDLAGKGPEVQYFEVDTAAVLTLIDEITALPYAARSEDQRIPASRVDMIVVALLLLRKILSMATFEKIGISTYALKEGVASEII